MDVEDAMTHSDGAVSAIAAAIGDPSRARMLFCLMDGQARTSTELAVVAEVSPSTASVHLHRLKAQQLVDVLVQGKHRYYSLHGPHVAAALEALSVLAGRGAAGARGPRDRFVPSTPSRLRAARTCYDHIAGAIAVSIHDQFRTLGWLSGGAANAHARVKADPPDDVQSHAYELTTAGAKACAALGIDVDAMRTQRRRFAYACLDWSERRPHIGGALGAALLHVALTRKWLIRDLDSRALSLTRAGRREMRARFGMPE
jgi:DNA-binding transcriptional ArsR family regulator